MLRYLSQKAFFEYEILFFDSSPRDIFWMGKFYFSIHLKQAFFEWKSYVRYLYKRFFEWVCFTFRQLPTWNSLDRKVLFLDSSPSGIFWMGTFYFSTPLQGIFFEWEFFIFRVLKKAFLEWEFYFWTALQGAFF
jgi:hypothetical protein